MLCVCGFITIAIVAISVSVGIATTLGPANISLDNVRDILANHLLGYEIPVKLSKDAIVWEE